jgi:hypothetical protein
MGIYNLALSTTLTHLADCEFSQVAVHRRDFPKLREITRISKRDGKIIIIIIIIALSSVHFFALTPVL